MHLSQVKNIVEEIRSCSQKCYHEEYQGELAALSKCGPLIDTAQESKTILFISQAPSRQAMKDGVLSVHENKFFTDTLLKRLFAYTNKKELEGLVRGWQEKVFWIHTANCYPGRAKNDRNDEPPNMKCSNTFMARFINAFEPQLIVLMSQAAIKIFSGSIKKNLSLPGSGYPALRDTLRAQREFHQKNGADFQVNKKGKGDQGIASFPCIAISHLASHPSTEDQLYAVDYLARRLRKEFDLS